MPPLKVILLAVSLFLSVYADAQQFLFKHFDIDDGLPDNSITCVAQDSFGFVWFGTKDGVCRFDGEDFELITCPGGLMDGVTRALSFDDKGRLWFSTTNGLGYLDLRTGESKSIQFGSTNPVVDLQCDAAGNVWMIARGEAWRIAVDGKIIRYASDSHFSAIRSSLDASGNIWFSSSGGTIYQYEPVKDTFNPYKILANSSAGSEISTRFIASIDNSHFLVSTNTNDVYRFSVADSDSELLFEGDKYCPDSQVICLEVLDVEKYMIGTDKGLYIIDGSSKTIKYLGSTPSDRLSLSNDNIRCIFKDREERVWVGTFYSGLNLQLSTQADFYRNSSDQPDRSIVGNTVRSICRDGSGNVWLGTEDGFLNRIDAGGKVRWYGTETGLPQKGNFHSLLNYHGDILIATYGNGLYLFDPYLGKVKRHYLIGGAHCVCLLKTHRDELLVGTDRGLFIKDIGADTFRRLSSFGSYFVQSLYQAANGVIWIGTYGYGLWQLDPVKLGCTRIEAAAGGRSMDNYTITYICEDTDHSIWLATEGSGLVHITEEPKAGGQYSIVNLTRDDGLPSNITCAIAPSGDGWLWVSTNKGLFSLNPSTGEVETRLPYNYDIIGGYFRYGSVMSTPEGKIYMGTTEGMMAFSPSHSTSRKYADLYITDIQAGHSDETFGLSQPGRTPIISEKITVSHKDASFLTFRFAVPSSDGTESLGYRYSLSRRKSIISSKTFDNQVTFAGISPGKYSFEVMLDGSESASLRKSVVINVRPPLAASLPAKLLYVIAIASAAFVIVSKSVQKRKKTREAVLEKMETEKQKEIYDAKINFFTNITHEIRTPLTLIKMPVEKIINGKCSREELREDLTTVKYNTDRLLELSNQLLDLRKVENKQLQLNFLKEDICALVSKSCACFIQLAKEYRIEYFINLPDVPIPIMCAADCVGKIVANLVSNGLKYCRSSVSVSLEESGGKDMVLLKVNSDGDKISPANADKIFEPFYQERMTRKQIAGSRGTGLGLPFARSLAELHNGRLYLDKTEPEGNTFVLVLPKNQNGQIELKKPAAEVIAPIDEQYDGSKHYLLIVEDDAELNNYICRELSDEYNVMQAFNGDDALQIVKDRKVDLVISDIMMPGMDGCALCNAIKSNLEYSHIPVLLITAAAGMDKRIETLKVGADGYLEKPFGVELLRANIANLFYNRDLTFKQFADSPLSHFNGLKINNMDDEYMDRLHSEVMKHLSEQNLNIDLLTTMLGTSKSTLFRKVKANTGLNINEYVKLCRLKRAAELLAERKYRINEVVYLVGFSSPSYFAASFEKQFNILPSAFVKKMEEENRYT